MLKKTRKILNQNNVLSSETQDEAFLSIFNIFAI